MPVSCQSVPPPITVVAPTAPSVETEPPPTTYEAAIIADEGLVYEEEGHPRIHVPPDALSQDGVLIVEPLDVEPPSGDVEPAGPAYEITLGDATLTGPIEIALPLDMPSAALSEGEVFAAYLDDELGWIALPSWLSDDGQWVHTTTDHLTTFVSFFSWSPLYPRIKDTEATPNPIEDVATPPCFTEDLVVYFDAQDPDGEVEKVEIQFRFRTFSRSGIVNTVQFVTAINGLGLVIFAGDITAALPAGQALVEMATTDDTGVVASQWADITASENQRQPGRYYGSLNLSQFSNCDYFDVGSIMDTVGINQIVAHIRVTDDWGQPTEEWIDIPVHSTETPYAVLTSPGGGTDDFYTDPRPTFRWQMKNLDVPRLASDVSVTLLYAQGDKLWGRRSGVHRKLLKWDTPSWKPPVDAALQPGKQYVWGMEVTYRDDTRPSELQRFVVRDEDMAECFPLETLSDPVDGGTVVALTDSDVCEQGYYEDGYEVRITYEEAEGYQFVEWSGDAQGNAEAIRVAMDGPRTVTAHFEEEPTCHELVLFGAADGVGDIEVLTESGTCPDGWFEDGTTVHLRAIPATGYRFDRWYWDTRGTDLTTTIVMDGKKGARASFEPEEDVTCYPLVISPIPSEQGSVSVLTESDPCEEGWFEEGTVVQLRAVARDGFKFRKWTASTSGTSASTSLVMDGDKRATASFDPVEICNGTISFVQDVTVPDGTAFDPGESFTKVWRVRASDDCGYSGGTLYFDSGDRMGGAREGTVPAIAAGDTYDISVTMEAPETAGPYSGGWAVSQPSGDEITVWVSIRVGKELPDVRGKSLGDATAILESLGHGVTWKDGCDPAYGLGLVSAQQPPPGGSYDPQNTVVVLTRNRCAEAEIAFWAERAKIIRGECTNLHWDVENVKAIYLHGGGVTGHEVREVCPTATVTYTLRVVTEGDQEIIRYVTIEVEAPWDATRDEFDGPKLSSAWTWTDPDGDGSYSLTANPGHIRLTTPCLDYISSRTGDKSWNTDAGRVMQNVTGDFLAETSVVMLNPYNSFQLAGILLYQDKNNWVRLSRGFSYSDNIGVGWASAGDEAGIAKEGFAASPTFLRLERRGSQAITYYSADGSNWSQLHSVDMAMGASVQVGVYTAYANNCFKPTFVADFDYFELTPR